MEGHFRDTFADFSNKIKELYEIIKLTNPSNPSAASTSKQVHWGGVA
jgi:aspartate/methionine/tyrosine aminotransferase